MTTADLTDPQKSQIRITVEPMRDYFDKLLVRMAETEFPKDDPLWLAATKASDAMREMELLLFVAPGRAHGKG